MKGLGLTFQVVLDRVLEKTGICLVLRDLFFQASVQWFKELPYNNS